MNVNNDCQMQSYPSINKASAAGNSGLPVLSQVRLFFRRHLDRNARRNIKRLLLLNHLWQPGELKNKNRSEAHTIASGVNKLVADDIVRIRSREEILATLDPEGKLEGCSFIGRMWQYCGTTQKVMKPVHRFVDERNYKIVNAKQLVLLEGVMCSGTDFYGACDRSCYFFWREEWLKKV